MTQSLVFWYSVQHHCRCLNALLLKLATKFWVYLEIGPQYMLWQHSNPLSPD